MIDRIATFTTSLSDVPEPDRDTALDDLARAMHAEFPAFRVAQVTMLDDGAVLELDADEGTPAHAVERLDGWGHINLSLSMRVLPTSA